MIWQRDSEETPEDCSARIEELVESYRGEAEAKGIAFDGIEEIHLARALDAVKDETTPGRAQARKDETERQRRAGVRGRLKAAGFPAEAADAIATGKTGKGAEVRDLKDTELDSWLWKGWGNGSRLFALVGKMGTGKTLAASRFAIRTNVDFPVYINSRAYCDLSPRMRDDRAQVERIEKAQLLIIDELGLASEDDKASGRLEVLIHLRWEERRPTVVIGNISAMDFENRYGPRVMSRLFESGGMHRCTEIMRAGENRRLGRKS